MGNWNENTNLCLVIVSYLLINIEGGNGCMICLFGAKDELASDSVKAIAPDEHSGERNSQVKVRYKLWFQVTCVIYSLKWDSTGHII